MAQPFDASVPVIHRCPTYYVESRGWSQEVHTLHLEYDAKIGQRFAATGRRTPLCPERSLTVHGSTPDEAVENFRRHLITCDWKDYFSAISRRFDDQQATINNLIGELDKLKETLPPSASQPDALSSPTNP